MLLLLNTVNFYEGNVVNLRFLLLSLVSCNSHAGSVNLIISGVPSCGCILTNLHCATNRCLTLHNII